MRGATILRRFRATRQGPTTRPIPKPQGPSRIARQLALARHIERLIDEGHIKDYAHAASTLGLTRARLTQIMNLLLLAPAVQELILFGHQALVERSMRVVAHEPNWELQLRMQLAGATQPATNPR